MPFEVIGAEAAAYIIGDTAATMSAGGAIAAAAATGAMTAAEALSAGATAADMVTAGVSVSDMAAAGYTAADMAAAGVPAEQLAQGGYTAEQLANAGYTSQQLQTATPYLEQAAANSNIYDPTVGSNIGDVVNPGASPVQAPAGGGIGGGGNLYGGTSWGDVLGTAKTGAQLVGGIGQLAGAAKMLGGTGVNPKQADPNAQYRAGYASQLYNLLSDPSTITSTPGYQFNLAQGLQAQQAQQAAQGRLVSGGGMLQAQQFGQQYATSQLSQQEQMLAQLSGATQAPGTGATAQQNIAQSNLGQFAGGLSALGTGATGVLNPLQTLYAQYNTPSPSVG